TFARCVTPPRPARNDGLGRAAAQLLPELRQPRPLPQARRRFSVRRENENLSLRRRELAGDRQKISRFVGSCGGPKADRGAEGEFSRAVKKRVQPRKTRKTRKKKS